ncbi:hypothetical protein GGI12_004849 [Dipsacomyces acuminosporus]|nr:hypothetical protein GGI12_004849 [Dipsacomyces acuminosporus]
MADGTYPHKENAFTLYYSSYCPSSQCALRVFEAASVPVHAIEIDLMDSPEWHRLVSPELSVPVLRTPEGELLNDANAITQHIADRYPESQLCPTEQGERTQLDSFVGIFRGSIVPNIFSSLMAASAEAQEEAKDSLLAGIKQVSDELVKQWQRPSGKGGPFWYGDKFSLAEIDTSSFVNLTAVPAHWRGFSVPQTEEFAAYNKWVEAIYEHPLFIKFQREDGVIIEDFKRFVAGAHE